MAIVTAPTWEHFAHQADIGIRGIAPTKEQAFEQAAMALTAVITDPASVKSQDKVNITCQAPDDESLLVNWLNTLLYEMATRKMLFGKFEVFINEKNLSGLAWGEKIDVRRHMPSVEIKGATYTELSVKQEKNIWIAQCVVDV